MSIIIEATASRIRPALRSASALSLLRSMHCFRVIVDKPMTQEKACFRLPLAVPLAVAGAHIFVHFD
ncbi:hypothetical protein ACVME8_009722 [Bradyrhizobium diazoefficiens]